MIRGLDPHCPLIMTSKSPDYCKLFLIVARGPRADTPVKKVMKLTVRKTAKTPIMKDFHFLVMSLITYCKHAVRMANQESSN